jgi:hypothetical protein
LCRIDAFGMVSWTPDAGDVVSVKVANSMVSEFTDYNTDGELTDPAEIEALIEIHKLLYAEGPTGSRPGNDGWQNITICYTMKDGREIYRQYRAAEGGQAQKQIHKLVFSNPQQILHADSLDWLVNKVASAYVEGMRVGEAELAALLRALWEDGQEGNLGLPAGKYDEIYMGYVHLEYHSGLTVYLEIWENCENTTRWMKDTLWICTDAETMLRNVDYFMIAGRMLTWDQKDELEKFCKLFAQDNLNGVIENGESMDGYTVIMYMNSGVARTFTAWAVDSDTYQWIEQFVGKSAP